MFMLLLRSAAVAAFATAMASIPTTATAPSGAVVVEVDPVDGVPMAHATVAQAQRHVRALRAAGASGKIVINIPPHQRVVIDDHGSAPTNAVGDGAGDSFAYDADPGEIMPDGNVSFRTPPS